MIKADHGSLPVIRSSTGKCIIQDLFFSKKLISSDLASKSSIPLSECVAITESKPGKLQLVYPLEDTYRARYKSDYFPQNGSARRPRYIADSQSNHFITLKVKVH